MAFERQQLPDQLMNTSVMRETGYKQLHAPMPFTQGSSRKQRVTLTIGKRNDPRKVQEYFEEHAQALHRRAVPVSGGFPLIGPRVFRFDIVPLDGGIDSGFSVVVAVSTRMR